MSQHSATSIRHFWVAQWCITQEQSRAHNIRQMPPGAALEAAGLRADGSFSGASIWFLFLSLGPEPNRRDCFYYLSSLLRWEGAWQSYSSDIDAGGTLGGFLFFSWWCSSPVNVTEIETDIKATYQDRMEQNSFELSLILKNKKTLSRSGLTWVHHSVDRIEIL